MAHVFVSGCYDILHAGHIQFFTDAKQLGSYLTVSFASKDVLLHHKHRQSSLPDSHKKILLESMKMIDQVVIGTGEEMGLDFKEHFLRLKPDILAVTEDDKYAEEKKRLCVSIGAKYVVIPKKTPFMINDSWNVSTTNIIKRIRAPIKCPLRIDFAGGWLDCPKFSREDGFIVNAAIEPKVSLECWSYEKHSGLGGSAAWAVLNGKNAVESELNLGVGWQDPAIIREGGLCVWKSGKLPHLIAKTGGYFLKGKIALFWTNEDHDTPSLTKNKRDYDAIAAASKKASAAVFDENILLISEAVNDSYRVQLQEGMKQLPDCFPDNIKPLGYKYAGGGFGGYAFYIFESEKIRNKVCEWNSCFRPIEISLDGYE